MLVIFNSDCCLLIVAAADIIADHKKVGWYGEPLMNIK